MYLKYLVDEIHTTVLATVDENLKPVTCVIDMMLYDEDSLYFLTAKGKAFYKRLIENENISLSGIKGEDTMSSKSITIVGKAKEIGQEKLSEIFQKNKYMSDIYKNEESRKALTVFKIYEGTGEFFDLTKRPIFRESFSFGGVNVKKSGFVVKNSCNLCKKCLKICPQNCIDIKNDKAFINLENCLFCGICKEHCDHIERI